MTKSDDSDANVPLALVRALEQITLHNQQMLAHSERLTDYVARIDARVAGTEAVTKIVDENEVRVADERAIAAQKEIFTHFYEKSQQYIVIVVGASFAAYFAMLSTVSSKMNNDQLRMSAALMTLSLLLFVSWEIVNVAFTGWQMMTGKIQTDIPKWYRWSWPIVFGASVLCALPAFGLSLYAYVCPLIAR